MVGPSPSTYSFFDITAVRDAPLDDEHVDFLLASLPPKQLGFQVSVSSIGSLFYRY